ncbi:MAG: EpsG family protein [Clostridia bacterium]|nr:EpsG family protein [Clostridia bacterium]
MDFGLEFVVNKKIVADSKLKKILNFIFKFRLISVLALVIISTFRCYSVGADTLNYRIEFENFKSLSIKDCFASSRFEIGYLLTTMIIAKIGLSFRFVILLSSLFTAYCFIRFIKEFSPNKCMSIVMFVGLGLFAQSLNIIRHIIALDFVLLSIILLFKNKIFKSIILVLIASLFHVTALVAILFVGFKYLKLSYPLLIIIITTAVVGIFIFPYAMKFIEQITPLNFYTQYFVVQKYKFYAEPGLIDNLYSIALTVIFIVLLLARKYLTELNEQEKKHYDFYLIVYLFVPLIRLAGFVLKAQSLLNRLNVYFFFALIILLPMFLKGFKLNKNFKFIAVGASYIIILCYMYYFYAIQDPNGVVPFSWVF